MLSLGAWALELLSHKDHTYQLWVLKGKLVLFCWVGNRQDPQQGVLVGHEQTTAGKALREQCPTQSKHLLLAMLSLLTMLPPFPRQ